MVVRPSQTSPPAIVILSAGCRFARETAASEGPMRYRSPKSYYVYIMTNRSKTLYTGVTNSLERRVWEHKVGTGSAFAAKYKLDRLVYSNASTTSEALSPERSKSRDSCGSRRSP